MKKKNNRASQESESEDVQISECRIMSQRKIFFFHEERSSLWLHNVHEVETLRIKIDDCEIRGNESIRCDFMLVTPDAEIYIELKGGDVNHAVEQIRTTLRRMSREFRKTTRKAYIICSSAPKTSSKNQKREASFKKEENCDLIIRASLSKCPPSNNPIYQY